MTTNAYAAKREIIRALQEHSQRQGHALTAVQVLYAWNASKAQDICVYGGGVVFDQPEEEDLVDGKRRLVKESATVGLHIRVANPNLNPDPAVDDIEATDIRCEEIGEEIGRMLSLNPHLAGGHSVSAVRSGQGDYSPDDTKAVSTLAYRVSVESYLDPGDPHAPR